ncbi:MAG: MATE family efflux transporter [Clostridia bacterium]|nr:MATE family efflux transporter [Clostridia bacterium]
MQQHQSPQQQTHSPRLRGKIAQLCRWEPEFTRLFFRLVIPIALQNLVGASLHIVDNIMVSGLGEVSAAGVAQANRVTFIVQLFQFGVTSGAGIFASQYWGKRDVGGMRRVQGLALRLNAGIGLLAFALVQCWPQGVLSIFLPAGESFDAGLQYLLIVSPAYLITAIDSVFQMMLRSSERARVPMTASTIAIITNTVLNYGLIYGRLGLPAMGVRGVAMSTVFATALSLSINVAVSYRKKLAPAARLQDLRLPDRTFLARFFRTISPVVFNEGLWAMGFATYSVVYGRMGDGMVAAMAIVGTVDQLVFVLGWGIMHASSVIVGRSIGAAREEEAYLYAKRMLAVAVTMMAGMGVILLNARGPIVSLFRYGDETLAMAEQLLLISSFFLAIRAFNAVNIVGVLRSGGDTVFSMTLDLGVLWLIGVPLALLGGLALQWTLPAVYLINQGEECLKVLIGLPRFISKKWIRNLVKNDD